MQGAAAKTPVASEAPKKRQQAGGIHGGPSYRAAQKAALFTLAASSLATPALAAETSTINAADTAWMIVATALVLMMTLPGLALFYSGIVKKNVLATMAQSLAAVALISILWVAFGYSLAFSATVPGSARSTAGS